MPPGAHFPVDGHRGMVHDGYGSKRFEGTVKPKLDVAGLEL